MKINTAVALALAGLSLGLSVDCAERHRGNRRYHVKRCLVLIAATIAAATLVEYVFGLDLGIDDLLFRDPTTIGAHGRMSPVAAVCIFLLAISLVWLESWWAEWLVLIAMLAAHVVLLGYLYGVSDLYAIGPFSSIALHSAISIYVLAVGILLARPERGLIRLLAGDSPGSVLARRLMPAAFILPTILGLVRLWGQRAGLYGTGFGLAMFAASNTVCFASLIWWTATVVARSNVELVRSNDRLRALANVSDAFARGTTSSQTLLDQIARIIASHVGDGCFVMLTSENGEHLLSVATAHRDPAFEIECRTSWSNIAISITTSTSISAIVARTGSPRWADVHPNVLLTQSDEALKPIVARLNVHSFAVVPIRARQTVIGTLSLVRSTPGRSYTEDDLTLIQDLADRAGLAIENARGYEQLEQRVRARTQELETRNQQLSSANKDLERANKELEAFSYSVSHDLRGPLRAVNGFSEILLSGYSDALDDDGRDCLQRILASARRMATIVDDLLALSKVSHAELRKAAIDLTEITWQIVAGLRCRSPSRTVDVSVADGMVTVGDGQLLTIVLENLLGNAWKFTGKRTDAAIVVGREAGDVFFVRDNGAGFDMAHSAHLFEPFRRLHTDSEFEGTGIGLAIVRRIIERHGGRVWAHGTVGDGVTVRFTLAAPFRNSIRLPRSLDMTVEAMPLGEPSAALGIRLQI